MLLQNVLEVYSIVEQKLMSDRRHGSWDSQTAFRHAMFKRPMLSGISIL